MKLFIYLLFISSCLNSWSLDLNEAKLQGFVGEQINGYIGIVRGANGELIDMVRSINQQRYDHYHAIAQRNGTKTKQVELVGGRKALDKTPTGFYVKSFDGQWRKR